MPRNENTLANVECEDLVDELSARMKLEGDEADKFKHRCMVRAGYHPVPVYVKPEDDNKSRTGSRQSDDW